MRSLLFYLHQPKPSEVIAASGQLIKQTPDNPESNHIRAEMKRMISNPRAEPDALQNQLIDLLYINFELLGVTRPFDATDIERCRRQIESIHEIKPARKDALLKIFDLVSNYLFIEKEVATPTPCTP
ncbi:MAG: hypothetical protein P1U40_12310 [Coxiellaceae bacterium]|nr:hypothetical protein [Coxiellaceae bacterium]